MNFVTLYTDFTKAFFTCQVSYMGKCNFAYAITKTLSSLYPNPTTAVDSTEIN
jgi:hypothetical protein